jgi:hypothetical protein
MFKISAIGPQGHTLMARNTPTEALRKALELRGAGFANVRLVIERGSCMRPRRSSDYSCSRHEAKGIASWIGRPVQSYCREWSGKADF